MRWLRNSFSWHAVADICCLRQQNVIFHYFHNLPLSQKLDPRLMSEYGQIPATRASVYPKSVNGVTEIIQHAISFTLFGTLVGLIFGTTHYVLLPTGQERAPNRILSMGPRLRRDATGHSMSLSTVTYICMRESLHIFIMARQRPFCTLSRFKLLHVDHGLPAKCSFGMIPLSRHSVNLSPRGFHSSTHNVVRASCFC